MIVEPDFMPASDVFLEHQDGKFTVGFSDGTYIFDPATFDWTPLISNGRATHISSFPKWGIPNVRSN